MNNGEVICCFGGEEFVILLFGYDFDVVCDVVEILCEVISVMQVWYLDGVLLMVIILVGVFSFFDCGNQLQQLLCCVDEVLYCVKDVG